MPGVSIAVDRYTHSFPYIRWFRDVTVITKIWNDVGTPSSLYTSENWKISFYCCCFFLKSVYWIPFLEDYPSRYVRYLSCVAREKVWTCIKGFTDNQSGRINRASFVQLTTKCCWRVPLGNKSSNQRERNGGGRVKYWLFVKEKYMKKGTIKGG
jgi:hypothetical protein